MLVELYHGYLYILNQHATDYYINLWINLILLWISLFHFWISRNLSLASELRSGVHRAQSTVKKSMCRIIKNNTTRPTTDCDQCTWHWKHGKYCQMTAYFVVQTPPCIYLYSIWMDLLLYPGYRTSAFTVIAASVEVKKHDCSRINYII